MPLTLNDCDAYSVATRRLKWQFVDFFTPSVTASGFIPPDCRDALISFFPVAPRSYSSTAAFGIAIGAREAGPLRLQIVTAGRPSLPPTSAAMLVLAAR